MTQARIPTLDGAGKIREPYWPDIVRKIPEHLSAAVADLAPEVAEYANGQVISFRRFDFTATAGQTAFTGSDEHGQTLAFVAAVAKVYLNGVLLQSGTDYTTTSGTTITLASGAVGGDLLTVEAAKGYRAIEQDPMLAGVKGGSGFPTRRTGERMIAKYWESATIYKPAASPAGSKPAIVAEVWDTPGVLRHIWIATDNGGQTPGLSNFQEAGSVIRIFIDDDTTPRMEMSLGDFFMYYPLSDIFANHRVARTTRDLGGTARSGALRYLWMPYAKYLRVEIENTSPATTALLYAVATFSPVEEFESLGAAQLSAHVAQDGDEAWPVRTAMTICDVEGRGQLELLHLRYAGASEGDGGVMEGNVLIYVDNELRASVRTSGGEDFFDGSWYAMVVGGYPAGRAGNSDAPSGVSAWRFFDGIPIFFNTHLKIVWWVGQPNQGTIVDATVDALGSAYYWLDEPGDVDYTALDPDADPIYGRLSPAAGAAPATVHQTSGTWTVDAQHRLVQASLSADLVAYLTDPVIAEPFFVDTTARITDASAAGQEAFLWASASAVTGGLGDRVSMELMRDASATQWLIRCRDGFAHVGQVFIGDGQDLTGIDIDLALKCDGTRVTGYWRYHGELEWCPAFAWTSALGAFTRVGVATYTGKATFTFPEVRPLREVTS